MAVSSEPSFHAASAGGRVAKVPALDSCQRLLSVDLAICKHLAIWRGGEAQDASYITPLCAASYRHGCA